MTARIKNLGRSLNQGDYALDLLTGFPVVIRDLCNGAHTRYCEFFGFNRGFSGTYSKNLKPITEAEFKSLSAKRLLAPGFYFQPCPQRYWVVYDKTGAIVCMTVYKKGALEVVRRLALLAETCHSIVRYITYGAGSDSSRARSMIEVVHHALQQTEGHDGKV